MMTLGCCAPEVFSLPGWGGRNPAACRGEAGWHDVTSWGIMLTRWPVSGEEKWLHLCLLGFVLAYPDRAVCPKGVDECLLAGGIICLVALGGGFHSCWKVVFWGSLHSAGVKSPSFSDCLTWHQSKSFKWSGWIGKLPSLAVYSKSELRWGEDRSQTAALHGEGAMSKEPLLWSRQGSLLSYTVLLLTKLFCPQSHYKDKPNMCYLLIPWTRLVGVACVWG